MQKPKLVSLLDQAKRRQVVASPATDIAAVILASQTARADIVTRNFKGEIAEKVCAECDAMYAKLEAAMEAMVKREAQSAVSALPVPERVIERITERVEAKEEADEDDPPMVMTVQRKDGMIETVKQGGKTFDVIRNKSGLIKEVRERA